MVVCIIMTERRGINLLFEEKGGAEVARRPPYKKKGNLTYLPTNKVDQYV
jgi:hypothetical protein